jgi:sulfatase modifying factor 1
MTKHALILSAMAVGLVCAVAMPITAGATVADDTVPYETVLIGDPGNPADAATGYGAVAQKFRMGTTEVSIAQYVEFLNAVASIPADAAIESLYKEEMSDPKGKEDPGKLITRSGEGATADPYRYAASPSEVWPEADQRPVAWVTWFNAARFANWMHNGQTAGGTETGAYTLVDFQESGVVSRNSAARFWIPTEDQWYKAAYYDPTKPAANKYWSFPTRSDKPPRSALVADNAPAPAANFQNVYLDNAAGVLAPVGSYPGSGSHYGTLDQGGSLWEWTASAYPDKKKGPSQIVRGGSWGPGITPLKKTVRRDYGPMGGTSLYYDDDTGFRLAAAAN